MVERERESGGTRERERDWLADRRRWRETTTTSIQEGLSSSSKQAVGVDAASESGRARRLCVCDERRQDNNNGAGLCKHAGRACRRPRESGCVLDVRESVWRRREEQSRDRACAHRAHSGVDSGVCR